MSTQNDRLVSGLVFLGSPSTSPASLAAYVITLATARGLDVVEKSARVAHEITLELGQVALTLGLYRNHGHNDCGQADSLTNMPPISDSFICDLSDTRAALHVSCEALVETHVSQAAARDVIGWVSYVLADALGADFIHWRQPMDAFDLEAFLADMSTVAEPAIAPAPVKVIRRASRPVNEIAERDIRELTAKADMAFASQAHIPEPNSAQRFVRPLRQQRRILLDFSNRLFDLFEMALHGIARYLRGGSRRLSSPIAAITLLILADHYGGAAIVFLTATVG